MNWLINNKRICLGILIVVVLLALLVSCLSNPVPTLQSGYEIPQGTMPDREPTYDDVVPTPGGDSYRGNGIEGNKLPVWQHIESTHVKLDDGFQVVYRNHIETEAGQVRVNIFYIWPMPGTPTGMKNDKVVLKLLHLPDNIQIQKIGEGLGGPAWLYEIILTAEIPPEVKPGDYDVAFILFINEKYEGTLPCTIHVVNKNETPSEHPVWHITEDQALHSLYDNYSSPVYNSYTNQTIPKTVAPTLLSPPNGATNLPVNWVVFYWTPFKENTTYVLCLARDEAMVNIVDLPEITVTNYPYIFDGTTLDYDTEYYWQVMAHYPTQSEWSNICSFRTEAAPLVPSSGDGGSSSQETQQTKNIWELFVSWIQQKIGGLFK